MAVLENLPRDGNGNIPLEAAGKRADGSKVPGYITPDDLRQLMTDNGLPDPAVEAAQLSQQAVDALKQAFGPAAHDVERWRSEGWI